MHLSCTELMAIARLGAARRRLSGGRSSDPRMPLVWGTAMGWNQTAVVRICSAMAGFGLHHRRHPWATRGAAEQEGANGAIAAPGPEVEVVGAPDEEARRTVR